MIFKRYFLHVNMPDGTTVKMPYFVCGKGDPVVYIQAAQHGVELTGIYTIRLLIDRLKNEVLNGRIILVPIANPLAVMWRRHFYRMELGEPYSSDHPHQMNRLWPGDPNGNETQRIAYALYSNLIKESDYVIDLHCWEMWRCSCALGFEWDKISIDMCRYSLLDFISLEPRERFIGKRKGMLTYYVTEHGGHGIVIEHSGQRWVFVKEANRVCDGIINILRYIGVIEGKPKEPKRQFVVNRDKHIDIIAPYGSWILVIYKSPGDEVRKGDLIATLLSLETFEEQKIYAPSNGIIYEIGATRPHVDTRPSEEVMVILKGEKYRIATIYET